MKHDYVHVHSLTDTPSFIETNVRENSEPLI